MKRESNSLNAIEPIENESKSNGQKYLNSRPKKWNDENNADSSTDQRVNKFKLI